VAAGEFVNDTRASLGTIRDFFEELDIAFENAVVSASFEAI
jgi:hypothetical protein